MVQKNTILIFMKKKSILIYFITLLLIFPFGVYAQSQKVKLSGSKITLKSAFEQIEKQTGLSVDYDSKSINVNNLVTSSAKEMPVSEAVELLLKGTNCTYSFSNNHIVVTKALDESKASKQVALRIVKGTVTDSNGDPIIGATVVEKNTQNGTVTDLNGNYSLANVASNATLVVSYVGMKTQELALNGKSELSVSLSDDAINLSEVVAIGYGTQKKRDVTGSLETVKAAAFNRASNSGSMLSLLQGQAAGVSVQSSSGALGSEAKILIRGLSSVSASTSPLYIIDGVPAGTNLINQSDVESIQILKDAAATSIYGAKGSNGIILITTKTGSTGKPSIQFDYSTGISTMPFQQVGLINTNQWFEMMDESSMSYRGTAYDLATDYWSGISYSTEKLTRDQATAINTDWKKAMLRTGSYHNANLSISGGDKLVKYFISGVYRNDKGIIQNDGLDRYGIRSNIDFHPRTNLSFGSRINLELQKRQNSGGEFKHITSIPFLPIKSLADPTMYFNPLAGNRAANNDINLNLNTNNAYRALIGLFAEYSFPFIKGLSARTELAFDYNQSNTRAWKSKDLNTDGFSTGSASDTESNGTNFKVYLTYDKSWEKHNLNIVGGTESQRSTAWLESLGGKDLVGIYHELGNPNQKTTLSSSLNSESYSLSYFGRANYKFMDRYLAALSYRRDGSSTFTPEYRWGNFFAFSAGWIITDEAFMSEFGKNNFLKLRGSIGQSGNSGISPKLDANGYSTGRSYGSADIVATNGTLLNTMAVDDLRWETTTSTDIGVDYGFFKNRINGSLAFYRKYVKDLLLSVALPLSTGIESGAMWRNIGDLVNEGVELSVLSTNINTKKFKWQTSFNIAFNHNEVKKLTPVVDAKGTGMASVPNITKVGYGIRDYYLADFAGIDPATGVGKIYALDKVYYTQTGETRRLTDADGNYILLDASTSYAGANYFHHKNKNAIPKYYGGITNMLNYGNFDFSMLITFSGGNYIYDIAMRQYVNNFVNSGGVVGLSDHYNNRWKAEGDNAKYGRLLWKGNMYKKADGTSVSYGDPRAHTTQFLYKGDYLKLKSVTLGYTLPVKNTSQNFRVYASFDNLYTLTQYPGWDPEGQGTIAEESWVTPQLFTASLGLSLKF